MRYIAAEDIAKAKEMDLLTYLRNYEPQELVHLYRPALQYRREGLEIQQ